MVILPSRTINEGSQVIGLNGTDLMGLGGLFLILQQVFVPWELEWLPLILTAIVSGIVISIRLKFRRKILRDMSKYFLIKWMKGGYFFVRRFDKNL